MKPDKNTLHSEVPHTPTFIIQCIILHILLDDGSYATSHTAMLPDEYTALLLSLNAI